MALRNIDLCLPELSEAERTRIARASFRHAAYTVVDSLLIPKYMRDKAWLHYVEIDEGVSEFFEWIREPTPSFNLSAHLGSWEVLSVAAHEHKIRFGVVYRPLSPPSLNHLFLRLREFTGSEGIPKKGAGRALVRLIRENRPAALLVDQNGGDYTPVIPFFGVPARWQSEFTKLAVRGGGRVSIAFCVRDGERFSFRCLTPTLHEFAKDGDRMHIMRVYAEALERAIRHHPEQYLWMHKRFRSRPDGARDRYRNLPRRLSPEDRQSLLENA